MVRRTQKCTDRAVWTPKRQSEQFGYASRKVGNTYTHTAWSTVLTRKLNNKNYEHPGDGEKNGNA